MKFKRIFNMEETVLLGKNPDQKINNLMDNMMLCLRHVKNKKTVKSKVFSLITRERSWWRNLSV